MPNICIFEDNRYPQLTPLVYARAAFELRCGLFSVLERVTRRHPNADITLFCRDYLSGVLQARYPHRVNVLPATDDAFLFLNGRAVFSTPVPIEGPEEIGIQGNTLVYARLKGRHLGKVSPKTFLEDDPIELFKGDVPVVDAPTTIINYFWDIVQHNKAQIGLDFAQFVGKGSISGKLHEGVYLMNKDHIFIDDGAVIKPCCVIDAENGPIYLGRHVTIAPNTTIEGPVYVGDYTIVQPNTRLRSGSNVGNVCKVGGEIVNTVIHGYSNKQHDGFLGDSYVGSWVNIGADTVNSNLLNTYGKIKVQLEEGMVDTGLTFLGMAVGDYTKTAINTTIMTGSVFGFACNIITHEYPPKYLPPFAWYSNHEMKVYTLEKALQVAKIVMHRRNKEMTAAEEHVFRTVFQLTCAERNEACHGKRH